MKKSVCVVLFIFLVVSSMPSSIFAQQQGEYKKIYRLGVAPLVRNGVKTIEDLEILLTEETETIALLLNYQQPLIDEFYRQLFHMKFDENKFVSVKIDNMSYMNWDKKPKLTGKVEWAGKEQMDAYFFKIDCFDKLYWFLIPKACGNICLWKIEELKIEIVEEKIREWPSRLSIEPPPPVQKPKPPEPPVEIIKQPAQINFFAGAGIGGFYSCFMEYGTVEVGVRRRISGSVGVLASIGVGVPVGQNKNGWYTVPMVNLDLVGTLFEPVYLGAGIGFSGKMKEGQESQLEFGPTLGFRIGGVDFSFRGRVPFKGDPRGVKGNYKIVCMMRIFF